MIGKITDVPLALSLEQAYDSNDPLTKIARFLVNILTSAMIVLTPVQLITTAVGGLLIAITFGLALFIFTLFWWPFLLLLLGTSWLWLHAWYLRPILLIPGVVIALLAHIYVMLAPEPQKDSKLMKLSITSQWPLSWYLRPLTKN